MWKERFNNLKIGKKLSISFGIILALLITVGAIGINSLRNITYQLEIAKHSNTMLADALDAQGGSLRFVIYHDDKYQNVMRDEIEKVQASGLKAKDMMKSSANKEMVEKVIEASKAYKNTNETYYNLEKTKEEVGKERASAAGEVLTGIKELMDDVVYLDAKEYGDRITADFYGDTIEAQEIRNSFNRVRIFAQKYQLATSREEQDIVAKSWIKEITGAQEKTETLISHYKSTNAQKALSKILTNLTTYRSKVNEFRQIRINQRNSQTKQKKNAALVLTDTRKVRDGVYTYIEDAKMWAYIMIILGLIIAITASVFIGLILTRGITQPMEVVSKSIAKLSDATNDMATHLKTKLAKADWRSNLVIDLHDENLEKVKKMAEQDNEIGEVCTAENKILGAISETQDAINDVIDQVNSALGQVNEAVVQVATGSQQVASASQAMSQGATEQAASVEEISSSMHQIGGQARQNSENAGLAQTLANEAKQNVESGNNQMQEMVTAMESINDSSQNIAKIIKVIDEIAFQTNLLALNAAVEAARAGKHGKGFAVVAEEVKNLAERSAQAAKETTEMIEDSGNKVNDGSALAKSTATALNDILESVNKTASLVGEIAVASNEQASGVSQVTEGLSQIDKVTQHNTASAEETAASSEQMSSQSIALQGLIAQFKLKEQSNFGGYTGQSEKTSKAAAAPSRPAAAPARHVSPEPTPAAKPVVHDSEFHDDHLPPAKKLASNDGPEIKLDDDEFGRY